MSKLNKLRSSTNTNSINAISGSVVAAKSHDSRTHTDFIPLDKISLDPKNARELHLTLEDARIGIKENDPLREIKQKELKSIIDLSETIREHGLINPIVVYKSENKYILISGERRTLSSVAANLKVIKATIYESKPDELEVSSIQLIENLQREDYTLWEAINAIKRVAVAKCHKENIDLNGLSATKLSELIRKSIQTANQYLILIKAPDILLQLISEGKINNVDKAVVIATAPQHLFNTLAEACINGATLKQLKDIVAHSKINCKDLKKERRGSRTATKVNFGVTTNYKVAKFIFDTLLKDSKFQHLKASFNDVNWEDLDNVTNAFKKLVKILEKQV